MLTKNQIRTFNQNGYVVINNFINSRQRKLLMRRAEQLIDEFQPSSMRSVFSTDEQERTSDDYFLNSGDQIRFFFAKTLTEETSSKNFCGKSDNQNLFAVGWLFLRF